MVNAALVVNRSREPENCYSVISITTNNTISRSVSYCRAKARKGFVVQICSTRSSPSPLRRINGIS